MLEEIRQHRRTSFPTITAELVAKAWSGLLDEEPRAQSVAEPPRYDGALWAPQEAIDPITHVDPFAKSEAQRRYDEVYSRLKFE